MADIMFLPRAPLFVRRDVIDTFIYKLSVLGFGFLIDMAGK
jgi:hypothetical protein